MLSGLHGAIRTLAPASMNGATMQMVSARMCWRQATVRPEIGGRDLDAKRGRDRSRPRDPLSSAASITQVHHGALTVSILSRRDSVQPRRLTLRVDASTGGRRASRNAWGNERDRDTYDRHACYPAQQCPIDDGQIDHVGAPRDEGPNLASDDDARR